MAANKPSVATAAVDRLRAVMLAFVCGGMLMLACRAPAPPPPAPPESDTTAGSPVAPAGGSLNLLWEYPVSGGFPLSAVPDAAGRPYLFVAAMDRGVLVLELPAANKPPRLAAKISAAELGGPAMALTQKDNLLGVALGNLFAAGGAPAGLAMIDITDPQRPQVRARWQDAEVRRGSTGILLAGDRAFLAAMNAGVMAFDVSQPGQIRHLSTFQPDPNWPVNNPNRVQHPNARGMAVRGDLLYLAYDPGGLRVIDISDPTRMRETGRYINAGMGRKQQAYNNVILAWPYAYAAIDYAGLEVLEVSDPANIRQVAWLNPWRAETQQNLWFGSPGHANQLTFDATGKRVIISGGDSDLMVVDISDPRHPTLAAAHGAPKDGLGTWGVAVAEPMVYALYMKAVIPVRSTWSGIKAFSLAPAR